MTPYYLDDNVVIFHADCELETVWLTGDVMITDPPYGMSYISNWPKHKSADPIANDNNTWARDRIIDAWGNKPAAVFGTWKVRRPANVRHLLVWDKGDSPGMGDLSLPWGHSCEEIYVFGDGWTGKRISNVLRFPTLSAGDKNRPDHPTPKPIGLMHALVAYAPEGIIVDPFMGSGSTLRAAKDLGRKAIGVEIDERYCEIAAKRMGQEVLL